MNVLELFAGIGGLSLGLERAGFHVVGQVEINPFSRSVLSRHWPEVPRHDDVRTAVGWWLSEPRPRVDVIAGGYPCQPESVAGARRGTGDARWLWPEFARIVHALGPRYVIGENVMGHRTSGLRFVLRDLADLGYTTRAGVVSAAEVGAPHRRQRIFVLAELADTERAEVRDEPGRFSGAYGEGSPLARLNGSAQYVADAEREGQLQPGGPVGEIGRRAGDRSSESRRWWAVEPEMGRVAHGVPGRVDRLTALGNAVVPQVAEFVGRLLLSGKWLDE
jgi:DNA (cytosine-5)-methyltransferase 1